MCFVMGDLAYGTPACEAQTVGNRVPFVIDGPGPMLVALDIPGWGLAGWLSTGPILLGPISLILLQLAACESQFVRGIVEVRRNEGH